MERSSHTLFNPSSTSKVFRSRLVETILLQIYTILLGLPVKLPYIYLASAICHLPPATSHPPSTRKTNACRLYRPILSTPIKRPPTYTRSCRHPLLSSRRHLHTTHSCLLLSELPQVELDSSVIPCAVTPIDTLGAVALFQRLEYSGDH